MKTLPLPRALTAGLAFALTPALLPAVAAPPPAVAPAPAAVTAPDSASGIFESLRPLVFQIKTAVDQASPKASYGTGFAIARDGLLITNYHVVSDVIQEDDRYQSFVVMNDASVPAAILAVDVLSDLALLRIDRELPAALVPRPEPPAQGARIFSLGLPQDLNMSIIDGLYNGILDRGPYQTVHVSAPLNSGMSGGPALNASGQLIGVNVATALKSHNISFLVPASKVTALLQKSGTPAPSALHEDIQRQLLDVQRALSEDILREDAGKLELPGWKALKPAAYLKCWSVNEDSREKLYKQSRHICHLDHGAYLASSLVTGSYELSYQTTSSETFNPVQFARHQTDLYSGGNLVESILLGYFGERGKQTRYSCDDVALTNRHGVRLKANFCLRGYLRYPQLLDADIKFTTLQFPRRALVGKMRLKGFTRENIRRVLERVLQSVEAGS